MGSKQKEKGRETDGSVVSSSSRGSELNFHHSFLQLTGANDPSSKGSDALFWSPQVLHSGTHPLTQINTSIM